MLVLPKVFVNSNRGAFAIANAVDYQPGTENAIAAGEDSGSGSHQGLRIDGDQSARRQIDFIFRGEEVEARSLADRHN
ncbi:MAG: hypothetical protein WBW82_07235, partial [Candidatus Sulfotelmatobacter sp.]